MGKHKPPRGEGGNGDNGCGPDLSENDPRENRISCNYGRREATECPYCNVKIHSTKYHRTSSKTCEGSQAYCKFTAKQLECSLILARLVVILQMCKELANGRVEEYPPNFLSLFNLKLWGVQE
jgi:hypothetical protein